MQIYKALSAYSKTATLWLLLTAVLAFGGTHEQESTHPRCGLGQLAHMRQNPSIALARTTLAREGNCRTEDLYDSVHSTSSEHFYVYYTLAGPHAVSRTGEPALAKEYLDTLLHYLEHAWTLHVGSLAMRPPAAALRTPHYLKSDHGDKYPIEILDLGLLRDTWPLLGGPCSGCYGLTWPESGGEHRSTLLIENDFYYQDASDPLRQFALPGGGSCSYTPSDRKLRVQVGERIVDYTEDWSLALQATAVHELYHACQLRYSSLDFYHFWWEASATGVEEIGAPEVNDYLQYIDQIFASPQTGLDEMGSQREYGQGIFYQFLHHHAGPRFDHAVWSRIAQSPRQHILWSMQQGIEDSLDLALDSLFHLHMVRLFLSGSRSANDPWGSWSPDAPLWPDLATTTVLPSALPALAARVIRLDDSWPNASSLRNSTHLRLSLVSLPAAGPAQVTPTDVGEFVDGDLPFPQIPGSLHYLLISSGTEGSDLPPPITPPRRVQAYPQPWRGTGPLCFSTGQSDFPGVEIFNAAGTAVYRIPASSAGQHCATPSGLPHAPGLYRYRLLDESGLRPLLFVF